MADKEKTINVVLQSALPKNYPTHRHECSFWESLGRCVATFGFLEEVLAKAIFSFTATKHYSEEEIDNVFKEWLPKLEKALSDPLGSLINTYEKVVCENSEAKIENLESLLNDLREASKYRNVLCHGSWKIPDAEGASIPFFVNHKKEIFQTPIDITFLNQVQAHTVNLICTVINSVTYMGWQFPGTNGPGEIIWNKS